MSQGNLIFSYTVSKSQWYILDMHFVIKAITDSPDICPNSDWDWNCLKLKDAQEVG